MYIYMTRTAELAKCSNWIAGEGMLAWWTGRRRTLTGGRTSRRRWPPRGSSSFPTPPTGIWRTGNKAYCTIMLYNIVSSWNKSSSSLVQYFTIHIIFVELISSAYGILNCSHIGMKKPRPKSRKTGEFELIIPNGLNVVFWYLILGIVFSQLEDSITVNPFSSGAIDLVTWYMSKKTCPFYIATRFIKIGLLQTWTNSIFSSNVQFKHSRCGTTYLQKQLNQQLTNHIRKTNIFFGEPRFIFTNNK